MSVLMIPVEYRPGIIEKEVLVKKHGIIGAMSLCTRSTKPWSINVGIPAKKIKDREKDILELEENFRSKGLG